MIGQPIAFHVVYGEDSLSNTYTSFEDAKMSALLLEGKVMVDVDDWDRLKAAMVEALKKDGSVYAALYVLKQLGLDDAVGLAPKGVEYSTAQGAENSQVVHDEAEKQSMEFGLFKAQKKRKARKS